MKRFVVVCAVAFTVLSTNTSVAVMAETSSVPTGYNQANDYSDVLSEEKSTTDMLPAIFVDAEGNHYYSNYQGDKFYTDDPLPEPLTNEQKTYLVETYGVTIGERIPYDEVEPDTSIQSFEQIVEGLEYVENFDSEVQVNVQPSDTSATTNEDGVTPYASREVSISASIPDEYFLQLCNLYLYSNVKFNSSNIGITSLNSDGWDLTKNS